MELLLVSFQGDHEGYQTNKQYIDTLSYESLLWHWRFAPAGFAWLQGETGDYWAARMAAFKNAYPDEAAAISKKVGW